MLGTRASCEFDSVLRLLYPSLPPRPLDKIDLLSSIDRARVARLDRARSSSTAAATTASASASAAVGDDAVQHMYEQMGRTLLAPKGQTAYDHLESEAVTGVPQRSAQVPPKGVAKLRGIAKGCNCSAWSALRPCSSCSYRPNVPPRPARCNPRARGCNPTCQRLQPHAPDLQPLRNPAIAVAAQERVSAAALLLVGLRPSAAGSVLPAYAAAARLRFGVR